jgi:hypothetical protein
VSVLCPSRRQAIRALAVTGVATASALSAAQGVAAAGPVVRTSHGCYLVGQKVAVTGTGFAARRMFDVSVDGIDFGQSTTNASGTFQSSLIPGGLGAGLAQFVHHLDATDGTTGAGATFTVTRAAGAQLLAATGDPHTLRAPFQVWGFALGGQRRAVYVHYVAPSGRPGRTFALGRTSGQCGYLRTKARRVFPFSPAVGTWTLQVDTRGRYAARPRGAVSRIRIHIH